MLREPARNMTHARSLTVAFIGGEQPIVVKLPWPGWNGRGDRNAVVARETEGRTDDVPRAARPEERLISMSRLLRA